METIVGKRPALHPVDAVRFRRLRRLAALRRFLFKRKSRSIIIVLLAVAVGHVIDDGLAFTNVALGVPRPYQFVGLGVVYGVIPLLALIGVGARISRVLAKVPLVLAAAIGLDALSLRLGFSGLGPVRTNGWIFDIVVTGLIAAVVVAEKRIHAKPVRRGTITLPAD